MQHYPIFDPAPQLLTALRELPDVTVTEAYPMTAPEGTTITLTELSNTAKPVPFVDELSYQLDIWTLDGDTLRSTVQQADGSLAAIGFRRSYAGVTEVSDRWYHRALRYYAKVDRRTLRLVE